MWFLGNEPIIPREFLIVNPPASLQKVIMANYNTIVTPEKELPCTQEQADTINAILDAWSANDDEFHGFTFTFESGAGYLEAEENGSWCDLPEAALVAIGKLISVAGLPYLEFGAAFTASRMIVGSHGGTAFRIYPDGTVVDRIETWPLLPSKEESK